MLSVALLLVLTASASNFNIKNLKSIMLDETLTEVFLDGMLEGIQINPDNPSPCIESYEAVGASYSTLISSFETISVSVPFDFVDNFNDFVNQFVASYDLCDYSSIVEDYFTDGKTALLNFLINFTANYNSVMTAYDSFIENYNNNETSKHAG